MKMLRYEIKKCFSKRTSDRLLNAIESPRKIRTEKKVSYVMAISVSKA